MIFTAVCFNSGLWLAQSQRVMIIESHYDVKLRSEFVLSKSQFEVSDWIRNHTKTDSIFATNSLCDQKINSGEPFPSNKENDCLDRNTLSWLGANGHRRILIEAPVYAGSWMGTDLQIRDYNMSIQFGRSQDTPVLNYLVDRGVDYFVFDKETSRNYGIAKFRNLVFENDEYAVVSLFENR